MDKGKEILNPKVSVIIPVYNTEKYLRECLDSVVNQTLKDIEIICIDDGSTDNSLNILKEYASKDNRFVILEQKNQGAGAARNKGLEIAKGEYLSFLDSDDYFESNMLEKMYNSVILNNTDIAICQYSEHNMQTNKERILGYDEKVYSMLLDNKKEYCDNVYKLCPPVPWNKLYRKSYIVGNNIKFQETIIANDVYFFLIAFALTTSISVVPDRLIIYRKFRKDALTEIRNKYLLIPFEPYKEAKKTLESLGIFDKFENSFYERLKVVINMVEKWTENKNYFYRELISYLKLNDDNIYEELTTYLLIKAPELMLNEDSIQQRICTLTDKQLENIENYINSNVLISSIKDREYIKYLFNNINDNPKHFLKCDLVVSWGQKMFNDQLQVLRYAIDNGIPIIYGEDGFIRSADTWCNTTVDKKYIRGISFTFTNDVYHFDATQSSYMERQINNPDFKLTQEDAERARKAIDFIVKNHLTKYNHQPIYTPNIGRGGVHKVLVVDQSYGDFSISKGLADDNTFKEMLKSAVAENPEADIIVKTHPDALAPGSKRASGYYSTLESHDNIYVLREPINPISLLKYVDKVYVCTTQLGFEALMCGKEVHTFGMPFYAGWGLTIDKQKCERRTVKRTLEELFFITYIKNTHYVDPVKKCQCSIERAMEYLIELRDEYNHFRLKNHYKKTLSFIQNIFSVVNTKNKTHKVITILGLKIKLKRKKQQDSIRQDYLKFISHNIKEKSVLLTELNSFHGECLPGMAKYFLDLGYNVDVLLNKKEAKLMPFSGYFDDKISVFPAPPETIKSILCSDIIEQYDYLYINSNKYKNQSVSEYIGNNIKYPTDKIITMHHDAMSYGTVNFNTSNFEPVYLAEFPVLKDKEYKRINVHFYKEIGKHTKNNLTQFIVVGNIESFRKNHGSLLDAVTKLVAEGITDFKITIISRIGNLELPAEIKNFFEFKKNLAYPRMYAELEQADFLLTLFDTDNPEHDRYITTGSSGTYQLSYGFNIPVLIPYKFQTAVNGFNNLNSIGYNDNNDLVNAMKFCINMEDEQYINYKSNLANLEKEIYDISLSNLRKITGSSKSISKSNSYISLGENCFNRVVLTRHHLKPRKSEGEKSLPFDLCVCPLKTVASCLQNNFKDYFSDLKWDKNSNLWQNKKLHISYNHDIDCSKNDKDKLITRYKNRIENFKQLLKNNNKKVFIISLIKPDEDDYKYINQIDSYLIAHCHSEHKLIVVNISKNEKLDSRLLHKNIIYKHIPHPYPNYWGEWFKGEYFNSEQGRIFESEYINFVNDCTVNNLNKEIVQC